MARRRLKQTKKARAARRRYRAKKGAGVFSALSKRVGRYSHMRKGAGFFNPILVGLHAM